MDPKRLFISILMAFSLAGCSALSKTWDWFYEDDEEEVAEMEDIEEDEFDEDGEDEFEDEFDDEFEDEFEDEFDDEFADEDGADEVGDEPADMRPMSKAAPKRRAMQATGAPNRASVYFEYKSTTVPAGSLNLLQLHAQYLMANPGAAVRLEGHTDSVASGQYNQRLAMRRAQAVAQILMQMGVDASQIETVSRGEEQAASDGKGQGGALDRRVELVY